MKYCHLPTKYIHVLYRLTVPNACKQKPVSIQLCKKSDIIQSVRFSPVINFIMNKVLSSSDKIDTVENVYLNFTMNRYQARGTGEGGRAGGMGKSTQYRR